MSTTPSGAPSQKEKKYDRQLRLWGANGQNRLEAAHVALVNASATGCEILKNLVLPGVGAFTIIDEKVVEEADLGSNFFLDDESIGKPLAQRTAALLGELNPEVKTNHIESNLPTLLSERPELFEPSTTSFTHIVIVAPIPTSVLLQLPPAIPTFLVYSVGFTASLRISSPAHTIVETHPDAIVDLRLFTPWPELFNLMKKKTEKLDVPESEGGMSDHEHGHVPYVLLLLKYLEDWKAAHEGAYPSTYQEKNEFKALIQSHMRTNVPGGSEENYEEAIAAVLKNLRPPEISSESKAILLEDPRSDPCNLTAQSENFWFIASAVRQFVNDRMQGDGQLPFFGGFPDMKAESKDYILLQNIYRAGAKDDALQVHSNLTSFLRSVDPARTIPFDETALFCKHANHIRALSYRPLTSEYATPPDAHHLRALSAALSNWDADETLAQDYVALRAWQEFYSAHGRPPGETDEGFDQDLAATVKIAEEYVKAATGAEGLARRARDIVRELLRAGGGQLHNIAAFAGGMVAQEMIKVITKQYVPINNTVIFDGITSRTAVFEF